MATSLYSCVVCQDKFVVEEIVVLHILICHPELDRKGCDGSQAEVSTRVHSATAINLIFH